LTPTRDLLFVKDTAKGFIAIANSSELIGQDCNIATNSEITMQKMADTILALINPKAKIVQDEQRIRPAKSEVFRLFGDNSKIIEYTDWRPNYNLEKGLSETIQWFSDKNNLRSYKPGIYNV